jgi:formylglycine-generating enzyme required for sulfatase activity
MTLANIQYQQSALSRGRLSKSRRGFARRWLTNLGGFVVSWLLVQTAAKAGDSNLLENSLGMKFHKVTGTRAWFSIWETRVRDYQVFIAETKQSWTPPDFKQTPDDPAVNLSWDDATEFCKWLTARERKNGRLTERQRYRLPTDQEWSIAVGLGAEQGRTPEDRLQASIVWPWGCTWPPKPGDGNFAPELEVDKYEFTSPVGSFKPNQHGLFDMGGNVWEWCEDWYNDARVTKALRGGSFHDYQPKDLLAAYRFSATVHLSNDDIGFRVVLQDDTLVQAGPAMPKKP